MRELNNKKRYFLLKKNDIYAIVVHGKMFVFKNTENKLTESEIPFSLFLGNTRLRVKKTCFKPILKEQECKRNMSKVLGAANYLVQLFIKCDGKYGCTKTKLEKLLCIANIKYMKDGKELFEENMCIRRCGIGISYDFPTYLLGDIVISNESIKGELNDSTNNPIDESCIKDILFNPQYNEFVDMLTNDDKEALLKVFLAFGGYSSLEIGNALDDFKYELSESKEEGSSIIMKNCIEFFNDIVNSDDAQYRNNEIVRFILN